MLWLLSICVTQLVHSAGLDLSLHQLLLLASASDDEKEIEDIVGKVVQHAQE